MSQVIVLKENFEKSEERITLPESFQEINPHNLYIYVKAYLSNMRAGTAHTKTRGEVRGGGRKPRSQKGSGKARVGSFRSPIFIGGGTTFGPRNERNYLQKVNKKQIRLALKLALNKKADVEKLYAVDSLDVSSGKTKDAFSLLARLNERDTLIVCDNVNNETYLAFRNIKNCYLVNSREVNAYLVSAFHSVVIEKSILESVISN